MIRRVGNMVYDINRISPSGFKNESITVTSSSINRLKIVKIDLSTWMERFLTVFYVTVSLIL